MYILNDIFDLSQLAIFIRYVTISTERSVMVQLIETIW